MCDFVSIIYVTSFIVVPNFQLSPFAMLKKKFKNCLIVMNSLYSISMNKRIKECIV